MSSVIDGLRFLRGIMDESGSDFSPHESQEEFELMLD
jgi:hypothetical protein